MKSLTKLFLILVLFTFAVNAQTFDNPSVQRSNAELVIDFGMATTALDSAATDTSAAFVLEDYDGSTGDIFTLYTNLTSDSTTIKCDISIHGCETIDGTYVSLDTVQDAEADKGPVYTKFDIAGVRAKYYKVIIDQEDTGKALTGYHIKIRSSLKDAAVLN
jgi:hypothetical protein